MKIATMRIYFYHTQDIQMQLARYARGEFPGHLLYGATHLGEYDIDVVWHRFMTGASRLRNMLVTAWRVLRLGNKIDAVYRHRNTCLYAGVRPFRQAHCYLASPTCCEINKLVA